MILFPAGVRQVLFLYGWLLLFVMAAICKGIAKPPVKAAKVFLRASEYFHAKALEIAAHEFNPRAGK